MKARFSSMVPHASSVAARRMYGDFGAPLPLVVVVVVSDIDFLTKHPSVICRKISGVGWIGRGGRGRPFCYQALHSLSGVRPGSPLFTQERSPGAPARQQDRVQGPSTTFHAG